MWQALLAANARDRGPNVLVGVATGMWRGRLPESLMISSSTTDVGLSRTLCCEIHSRNWSDNLILSPTVATAASWIFVVKAASILRKFVTESTPLNCGLPQGSPASPILYIRMIEPGYPVSDRPFCLVLWVSGLVENDRRLRHLLRLDGVPVGEQ